MEAIDRENQRLRIKLMSATTENHKSTSQLTSAQLKISKLESAAEDVDELRELYVGALKDVATSETNVSELQQQVHGFDGLDLSLYGFLGC